MQFTDSQFRHQHNITIGVKFGTKTLEIDSKIIKVQIWDTVRHLLLNKNGQETFQAITRTYYKGAIGALLVYDITLKETFDHVTKWMKEIKNNSNKSIIIILVGNKKDLKNKYKIYN